MNFCEKKVDLDEIFFRSFKNVDFKFAAILVHHSNQSLVGLE